MKISHKWLQTYFKKPLPSSEEIAELLNFHIFEVEDIEKKTEDDVLDVKVLPDRASYCLSHEGVARELSALIKDNEFVPRDVTLVNETSDTEPFPVSIEAGDVCDRYSVAQIINVTKTTSPEWIVQALESVGQRSINVFADIANYIMLDIGQPMHVFDALKVKDEIIVRYARNGEKLTTLDNKEVVLDSNTVVIADALKPLALAGIKGGKDAETTHSTSHVVVESAHFDASYVRKVSSQFNIKTDSSKRFENKVSAGLSERALYMFINILKKIDPEILASSVSTIGSYVPEKRRIEIREPFIKAKLGAELSLDEVVRILKRGHIDSRREGEVLAVYPEDYRKDLEIKEDIIDEVGRLLGYEHINGIVPDVKSKVLNDAGIALRNKVKNFLVKEGFSEIMTYAFSKSGEVEVLEPLSEENKFLRTNLSDAMVSKLQHNVYYADLIGLNRISVFEFGNVWKGGREFMSLCLGITYKKAPKGVRANDDIKEVRDRLFEHLGVKVEILCTVDDTGGIISKQGKSIGVTNNQDGIMEVDFGSLIEGVACEDVSLEGGSLSAKYKPLSPFPFIVRDVAVFTSKDATEADVWNVISPLTNELLVRHELFDVFKKQNKETGEIEKISYAYRLVFQSHEKTLTDQEINMIMEKIYEALKAKGWEIR